MVLGALGCTSMNNADFGKKKSVNGNIVFIT